MDSKIVRHGRSARIDQKVWTVRRSFDRAAIVRRVERFVSSLVAALQREKSNTNDTAEGPSSGQRDGGELRPLSKFEQMPVELVLEIAKNLPTDGQLCLSYACYYFRYLFYNVGFFTEAAFCRSPSTSRWKWVEKEDYKALIEKDRLLQANSPKDKAYCVDCEAKTKLENFSQTSLKIDRRERQCLGHQGRIWFCPHRSVGLTDLKRSRGKDRLCYEYWSYSCITCAQKVNVEPKCTCHGCIISPFSCTASRIGSIRAKRPLMEVLPGSTLSKDQIHHALMKRRSRICPHVKMSDPIVTKNFRSITVDYKTMWRGIDLAPRVRQCRQCGIKFCLRIQQPCHPLEPAHLWPNDHILLLYIWIDLHFDLEWEPCDRAWISQVRMPSDMEELEREWEADIEVAKTFDQLSEGWRWRAR